MHDASHDVVYYKHALSQWKQVCVLLHRHFTGEDAIATLLRRLDSLSRERRQAPDAFTQVISAWVDECRHALSRDSDDMAPVGLEIIQQWLIPSIPRLSQRMQGIIKLRPGASQTLQGAREARFNTSMWILEQKNPFIFGDGLTAHEISTWENLIEVFELINPGHTTITPTAMGRTVEAITQIRSHFRAGTYERPTRWLNEQPTTLRFHLEVQGEARVVDFSRTDVEDRLPSQPGTLLAYLLRFSELRLDGGHAGTRLKALAKAIGSKDQIRRCLSELRARRGQAFWALAVHAGVAIGAEARQYGARSDQVAVAIELLTEYLERQLAERASRHANGTDAPANNPCGPS